MNRPDERSSLRSLFAHYDKDSSGTLSISELVLALTELVGSQFTLAAVAAAISELDADNDGSLSFGEMEKRLASKRRALVRSTGRKLDVKEWAKVAGRADFAFLPGTKAAKMGSKAEAAELAAMSAGGRARFKLLRGVKKERGVLAFGVDVKTKSLRTDAHLDVAALLARARGPFHWTL